MKPPSLRSLLEDPAYKRQFMTIPRLSSTMDWGNPWAVYARRHTGVWVGKLYPAYRDAWSMVVRAVRDLDTYEDVAIVSRRKFFAPGPDCYWDYPFEWCCRCRRPSSFIYRPNHHALRNAPVLTEDEPNRCYYCGIRRAAMPAYAN